MEFLAGVGERVYTDAGLSAFLLFVGLVISNIYHIRTQNRMHAQNRSDLEAAWASVWRLSQEHAQILSEIKGYILIIKDRVER